MILCAQNFILHIDDLCEKSKLSRFRKSDFIKFNKKEGQSFIDDFWADFCVQFMTEDDAERKWKCLSIRNGFSIRIKDVNENGKHEDDPDDDVPAVDPNHSMNPPPKPTPPPQHVPSQPEPALTNEVDGGSNHNHKRPVLAATEPSDEDPQETGTEKKSDDTNPSAIDALSDST